MCFSHQEAHGIIVITCLASITLAFRHPRGGGGEFTEKKVWEETCPRGIKKGEQGGMTSDVQYKLHFYFGRFFQDVVFQILGERMHNNFVDVIII